MMGDDQKDPCDFVCSFCGKEAIAIEGMISSQNGAAHICNECLKVIAEIQWEEVVETATKAQSQDTSLAATRLMQPQIITRFVSEDIHPLTWSGCGVDWICDGCGWRLRLDLSAQPPEEHSYEIVMGSWLDIRFERIPERKFTTMCTARWRRLL